jgi:hypothetical protein
LHYNYATWALCNFRNVQDPVNFSVLASSLTPLPRHQQAVVRELQEKQNQNKPTYHANTTTIISLSADHYQHPHQHHIRQYHVISPDDSSVSSNSNSSSNRSNNPVTPNTQSNETPVDFPDTVEVTLPISKCKSGNQTQVGTSRTAACANNNA